MRQTTIKQMFSCSGIGLHSGAQVSVRIEPASEHTGIVFEVAGPDGLVHIAPRPESVIATGLATTLGQDGVTVSTVEHLLAAARGLSIDNLCVRVEGGEVPILDGSAAEWVRLFSQAGITRQQAVRRVYRLAHPFELRDGDKYIRAVPHNGFMVNCAIDFAHASVGHQQMSLEVTPESFPQIARARTFGFLQDVETMRRLGLARGGSLDNAVVFGPEGVLNTGGLRFDNECVRHKLLDFVGDMAMLPLPLQARFETSRSGHELNNRFVRALQREGVLREFELRAPVRSSSAVRFCNGTWVAA